MDFIKTIYLTTSYDIISHYRLINIRFILFIYDDCIYHL